MTSKILLCCTLVLSGGLFGCSTPTGKPPASHPGAKQHFSDYLNQCADNEIRCLWFLQDDPRIGMVMTIDLKEKTATTVRDVYDWAEQGGHTDKLDDYQVFELQKIVSHLPPSDGNSEYGSSVFISTREGGITKVFRYDRHYPPAFVGQIYSLGGGYFYGDEND